jgi:hypothetical protein
MIAGGVLVTVGCEGAAAAVVKLANELNRNNVEATAPTLPRILSFMCMDWSPFG